MLTATKLSACTSAGSLTLLTASNATVGRILVGWNGTYDDRYAGIENVVGSNRGDSILGFDANNVVRAGDGDDFV